MFYFSAKYLYYEKTRWMTCLAGTFVCALVFFLYLETLFFGIVLKSYHPSTLEYWNVAIPTVTVEISKKPRFSHETKTLFLPD